MRTYLVTARKAAGLMQTEAANKLLISQNYLSDIESGRRQKDLKLSILKGISRIYKVPLDELIRQEAVFNKA